MPETWGRRHIGRRGASLLFFATLDLIYAVSLANPDTASRSGPQLTWLAGLAPLWVWASLWATVAMICGWHAFRRYDRMGFTAAIVIKVLWGVASFGGWAVGGVDRGYVAAAIWLAFAAFVWVIGGWPEDISGKGSLWTPP